MNHSVKIFKKLKELDVEAILIGDRLLAFGPDLKRETVQAIIKDIHMTELKLLGVGLLSAFFIVLPALFATIIGTSEIVTEFCASEWHSRYIYLHNKIDYLLTN